MAVNHTRRAVSNPHLFMYAVVGCIFLVGGLFVGYQLGNEAGDRNATKRLQPQIEQHKKDLAISQAAYQELNTSSTRLADDYNELYKAAQNYVEATRYAPKQNYWCNSYTYGMNSLSTYCY